MPSEEDVDNGGTGATPSVHFDTTGLDERIAEGVSRGLARVAQQNQPRAIDPELTELQVTEDDDEITRQRKLIHNEMIPLKAKLNQFQEFGLGKLADLTDESMSQQLPYRAKYRAEIDTELSKLPAAARADKNTLRLIHDTVAMRHIDEIRGDERESAARTALQDAEQARPTGNTSRFVDSNGAAVASPEEMGFDDEQMRMIDERGGPDAFARSISQGRYKTWSDYAESRSRMRGAPRSQGRPIIPFRRTMTKKQQQEGA